MKDFATAALLIAASFNGVSADADSSAQAEEKLTSTPRDILAELSASLQNPGAKKGINLGAGGFLDALACTADLSSGAIVDESGCATATDSNGAACIWCDASGVLGTGLCASADIQSMAGDFWESLCASADGSSPNVTPANPVPAPPVPATPNPTPGPTARPVDVEPDVKPDPSVPDALSCSMDADSQFIADQSTCVATKDTTATSEANCVWCTVPLLGGACVTNSDKSSISFLCSGESAGAKHLRGDAKVNGALNVLDPACLGDGLAGGTQESCAGKTDSNGEKCIWCDAGNDVFGLCATPSQKGYIGSYMNCADADSSPAAAVE